MGRELDELVGENLTHARGELSQQALAKLMRGEGHKWSQSTVWSVEKGERPLRLTEASVLAEILGKDLYTFLIPTEQSEIVWLLTGTLSQVRQRRAALQDAAEQLMRAQADLSQAVQAARDVDLEELEALSPGFGELLATASTLAKSNHLHAIDRHLKRGESDGEHRSEAT